MRNKTKQFSTFIFESITSYAYFVLLLAIFFQPPPKLGKPTRKTTMLEKLRQTLQKQVKHWSRVCRKEAQDLLEKQTKQIKKLSATLQRTGKLPTIKSK